VAPVVSYFNRDRKGAGQVAFVEGRRPGFSESVVFDESAVEVEPGGVSWAWPKGRARSDGCDMGRQRLCYELGERKKTPSPGDSARRSFGRCSTRTARGPHSG